LKNRHLLSVRSHSLEPQERVFIPKKEFLNKKSLKKEQNII